MSWDDDTIILKEFLIKRSIMRSRMPLRSENYKDRWFILTPAELSYHDGSLQNGPRKEKGKIPLRDIKAVEEVTTEALQRDFAFQVVYDDQALSERYQLYIVALQDQQRNNWITAIRNACSDCGEAEFVDKYHPGAYRIKEGKYTCCDQISRHDAGCSKVTFKAKVKPAANGRLNAGRQQKKPLPATPGVPKSPRPVKDKVLKVVLAQHHYQPSQTGDLALIRGDSYDVLDCSDMNWWRARDKRGNIGMIPSNYVEEKTKQGLEGYDWYFSNTSRGDAINILERDQVEGNFLVRESSTDPGSYTVSIFTKEKPEGSVRHYHIKVSASGQFYLSDKHPHPTIPKLINYHQHNCAGLVVRLRQPPGKARSDPATAGFGYEKYEVDHDDIQLFEVLGKGQFGEVRRGQWLSQGVVVAVKTMQDGAMEERDFIDEAKTMTQLHHANLVQLYGVSTNEKPIYIITEYMKHGALLTYLRHNKSRLLHRDQRRLLSMCIQVSYGMKYLEEHSFIHRDLAARNCLVADDLTVKVADFGLARFVLDDEYTSSSGSKFPIKWAPPEVLQYTKFSSKSDVWAFGVLCWEVFTCGDMPYGHMRNPDVINHIVYKRKRLERPPACTVNVFETMQACWEMEPDHRPSFTDIVMHLERCQQDQDYQ